MNSEVHPCLLATEEIGAILRARHWITEGDEIRLLPDMGGEGRRGLVSSGLWFRIGRDLQLLAERAREFHEACPEIAAKPRFFFEEGGWQWFGCEHDGTLQELRDDQLYHAVSVLEPALAATELPSTAAAAEAEIDAFLGELCRLPDFSLLDRQLLQRYVGNELKATLVESHPRTRWAHGNLTARAIRVDASGRVRLMEADFASRTHFFAEDWLRLGRPAGHAPALLAYCWLREILMDRNSLRPNLARALKLLDGSGRAVRQSLLAQIAGGLGPPLPAPEQVSAKLYASLTETFSEEHAGTVVLPASGWQCARFVLPLGAGNWNLRLDPAVEPGLAEIRRVSVVSGGEGELFSCDQPGRILSVAGTSFALKSDSSLLVFSYGNDPQVHLPRLLTHSAAEVNVEVWMEWRDVKSAVQAYGAVLVPTGMFVI